MSTGVLIQIIYGREGACSRRRKRLPEGGKLSTWIFTENDYWFILIWFAYAVS